MSAGYDPFKWADVFKSEEEYLKELIKEDEENAKERSSESRRKNASNADSGRK